MKTLQDYINESILDDEEVLIGDTKQDLNNPLLCLYHIYKNTHNFNKDKKNAQKYSNELIEILNLKNYSAHIFESSITISQTKFINSPILSIHFDGISMYTAKNSKPKCIIFKINN